MNSNLIYDKPKSRGVANVLKRADQLIETEWSPVMELNIFDQNGGYLYPVQNGKKSMQKFKAMPYSSTRTLDKFIGLEIEIDTFISALENPASILYTNNLRSIDSIGYNCCVGNMFFTYGTVCSSFVSYALDLPIHRCTREYDIAPEFFKIDDQSVNGIMLGDVMDTTMPNGRTGGHVRMITAIGRDENGHVREVEISEGWEPVARRFRISDEEFNDTLLGKKETYQIFRYRYIDSVEYIPARFEIGDISNKELMLNFGNFSNYRTTEPVEFNINCDTKTLVIEGTGTKFTYDVSNLDMTMIHENEYKIFTVSDLKPDRYIAYCVKNDGNTLPVNFIVVKTPDVRVSKADGSEFSRIALRAVAPDGSALTKNSECLYDENGKLKESAIKIALTDGKRLIPAHIGVYESDGKLIARPAAMLRDENGNIVDSFVIGDNVTMYAYSGKENDAVKLTFDHGQCCEPTNYTWKEEAAIAYLQVLLTPDEISAGTADTVLTKHGNDFAHVMIFCRNEYGKITTMPVLFVME